MKNLIVLMLSFSLLTYGQSDVLMHDMETSLKMNLEGADEYSRLNWRRHIKSLRYDMENGKMAERLDLTIDTLIREASGELRKRGHAELADKILGEWNMVHRGFAYTLADYPGDDLGDHPSIEWLFGIHILIELAIGEKLCRAFRLHDLWTLAYAIPITFKCGPSNFTIDESEYAAHFGPFLGIIAYWGSYAICVGVTLGTGVIFLCGLVGNGIELLTVRFVSPRLSTVFFRRVCQ